MISEDPTWNFEVAPYIQPRVLLLKDLGISHRSQGPELPTWLLKHLSHLVLAYADTG